MLKIQKTKSKVGRKLYLMVLMVFLVFAVSFIMFQQTREKQYKISTLTMKLENYDALLEEDLSLAHDRGIILSNGDSLETLPSVSRSKLVVAETKLNAFIREHESRSACYPDKARRQGGVRQYEQAL